jgi:hypothetical protein
LDVERKECASLQLKEWEKLSSGGDSSIVVVNTVGTDPGGGFEQKSWSFGSRAELLTVDPSGFEVLICTRSVNEFCNIAKPDFPRSEGEIAEELLWVVRTPERSWKSSLTLRARDEEGPGESGLDHEGRDFASIF